MYGWSLSSSICCRDVVLVILGLHGGRVHELLFNVVSSLLSPKRDDRHVLLVFQKFNRYAWVTRCTDGGVPADR